MLLKCKLPEVDLIVRICWEAPRTVRSRGFGLTSPLHGGEITMGGRKKQIPVSYDLVPYNGECI